MEITNSIRKVKLVKGNKLQVVYDQTIRHESGPVVNEVSVKDGHHAHSDLIKAMAKLNFHLAVISEQVRMNNDEVHAEVIAKIDDQEIDISWLPKINMEDLEILKRVKVNGFQMFDNDEGVTLSGDRKLSTGKYIDITAPTVKYDTSDYRYRNELAEDMMEVLHEVEEFIQGKHAEITQLEMELVDMEDEMEEVTED